MKPAVDQDRYRIVSPLGAGSEASVWLAEEIATGNMVALKYFAPKPGVPALRELANTMQSSHPNIVSLLDFTYLAGGDCYLVFEYVAGGTLRDWMNENSSCDAHVALQIVRDLFNALTQIHGNGSVHCDVKPENILREIDPATGTATYKLADFGVARQLAKIGPDTELVGSPAYMAPERFHDEVYPTSDVYAVGIILYELLTGDRPFHGTAKEVARAHLTEPIPEIPGLDAEIQGFLRNLLQKNHRHRLADGKIALRTVELLLGMPLSGPIETPRLKPRAATPFLSWQSGVSNTVQHRFLLPANLNDFHLLEADNRLQIVADAGAHLEFYDGRTGQFLQQILSKTGRSIQLVGADGIVHAMQQKIRHWSLATREYRELLGFCPGAAVMALSPDQTKLAWTGEKRGEIAHLHNDNRVSLPAGQAGSLPHLAWINDHQLAICGGATKPKLLIVDESGTGIAEVDLPGQLLQASGQTTAPIWVAVDYDRKDSLTAIGLAPDGSWHQWRIPQKNTAWCFCAEGMLTIRETGLLNRFSSGGQSQEIGTLNANVEGMAVSPSQRFAITWRRLDSNTEITVYEFTLRN